jgi:hypothetical protein
VHPRRNAEPGEAAGELARRHHQHEHEQIEGAAARFEGAAQQNRGREQIE